MQTINVAERPTEIGVRRRAIPDLQPEIELGLLTACRDRHYAFGLAVALAARGVNLDVVGGDEIDSPELHSTPNLRFLNFLSDEKSKVGFANRLSKLFVYYGKLIRYTAHSKPRVLHILWNGRFDFFDRTFLMLYYKLRGKKVAFTAHNVNQARRDGKDSLLNRVTLKMQYRLCDHIFVHTQKMKDELCKDFRVAEDAVTVIRYPMNYALPDTELTPAEAKHRLGLDKDEKAILFFGKIRPYKGIEHLVAAFKLLSANSPEKYRLIIAGEPNRGAKEYLHEIQQSAQTDLNEGQVILRFQFIPDEQMELYFKGADVLVLPYNEIFQSGILFLSYSFGLPVVATDVGSFREDIIEGRTGFLCKPGDPADLAKAIEMYFASDLFKSLKIFRLELKDYAHTNHSWDAVAALTCKAYARMLGRTS
jgi:glycosyltransferase involved in cell wall biosynthesis